MHSEIYSYKDKNSMEFDINNSHLTVKIQSINDQIARLCFVCKDYNNIKNESIEIPMPQNATLVNLDDKKDKQTPFNNGFFIAFFANYVLQIDGNTILKISNKKTQDIKGNFLETRNYTDNGILKCICRPVNDSCYSDSDSE